MTYLDKCKAKIYYEVVGGEGPWITLINGYTRSCSDFNMLAKKLQSENFRVLIFDNRGAGKTSTTESFTINEMAGDVLDLWSHLKIQHSHVLGISMGGVIAQEVVELQENKVLSVVLISTAADTRYLPKDDGWPDKLDKIEEKLTKYFSSQFIEKNQLLLKAMAKNIHKSIVEGEYTLRAQMQKEALLSHQIKIEMMKKNSLPVLIIHGDKDQLIPIKAAEEMSTIFSQASLCVFEGCGHLLLAEDFKKLKKELLMFWSKVTA